ncbi:prolyl oligopeptidase family serine peptidase [Granulicella cerasi]|uniref:Prolyl oligopeptidase family serine peptidase n=1 Tax=Granulicella cerasi TaxID=741063 RepID=A0ABW1ZBZ5_9BACT|nr:S9 family peptidase [Granulicella cerasi]
MRNLLAAAMLPAALAFGCVCTSAQTPAPAKRPMTFADLMAVKRVSDPQVSPSGKWVLFSVTDVSLEKNSKVNHLWAVPSESGSSVQGSGSSEKQVTTGSGESNGRFSPDGKWVMYTSSETGSSQIWLAPWDEKAGRLGAAHQATALETEADGAIWAPDSRHILFTSSVWPECESKLAAGPAHDDAEAKCNADKDAAETKNPVKARVFDSLLYRHWNQFMGPKHSHIFYADALAGTHVSPTDVTPASVVGEHEAPTFSLGGPLGYAISPDGKEVAYVVNLDKVPAESTNNDVFVLAVGADPHTAKKVSTAAGSDDGPQYSPDGKWLAWRSQARNGYESDKFDLVVMDRATGNIRNLTSKFDRGLDEFAWGNASSLVTSSSYRGHTNIQLVTLEGKLSNTYNPIEAGSRGEYSDIVPLHAEDSVIAIRIAVKEPAEIVKISNTMDSGVTEDGNGFYHFFGTRHKNLSHLNDALVASLELSRLDEFEFAGANGTKVQGFLVKPPNFDPAKKYPVKFLIHGGPQGAWGDAWSYRWNPELFAADGYVVVMVNPRGSSGYGQKFLEQVSGDWGGRAYEDLMKGLDYAEQHYSFIDKDRECALGASYGGYMADWVLTHTNRFKCIVTHDGMYNPQSAFGTTEELWFNEWEYRPLASNAPDAVVEQTKPAHPWDFYDKPVSEDPFRKWSPMLHIKDAHTPTLVVHGQRDYRLDVSEGFQLFTALQLLGVPSKMLYFPDEGHWVMKPKNSELWYETVNDWCDKWTHSGKYAMQGAGVAR